MHVITRTRPQKQPDFIPTVSVFARPGHRLTRNKRFRNGEFIGMSKPAPVLDKIAQAAVREAYAQAAKLPRPQEGGAFDLNRYRPLPGRVLVTRGPLIKEENGVLLPENAWHYGKHFFVIRMGEGVTACGVGDRVLFGRGFRPKEVWLGVAKFYIGREEAVVGIVEA